MKNILITGGNGFIGKNLVEAYKNKYRILAPDSKKIDITNFKELKKFINKNHVEIIIHAATYTNKRRNINVDLEVEQNLRMIYNIELLSKHIEKVLYFGSGAEFDKCYPMDMIRENDFGRSIPESSYGFSKYISNHMVEKSNNIYNLRLFGVFGKYEFWEQCFISNLCCKAMYNLPLTIRQNCLFDYIYIDDLVRIVEWFINNKPNYHSYNITTGMPVSLLEIAKTVQRAVQKDLQITITKEGWNNSYTASNDRLQQEVQFKFTPLESAVNQLYSWYVKNKDCIDYDVLKLSR